MFVFISRQTFADENDGTTPSLDAENLMREFIEELDESRSTLERMQTEQTKERDEEIKEVKELYGVIQARITTIAPFLKSRPIFNSLFFTVCNERREEGAGEGVCSAQKQTRHTQTIGDEGD